MSVSADELFFSSATDYYIAGRFSAFAGLLPVVGNLLHHAVEMYLKGGLAKTRDLAALRKLGHALPRVWKEFKQEFKESSLEQFDAVITALHAFEELRYPDSVLEKGMTCTVAIKRPPSVATVIPGVTVIPPATPTYDLCIEDIDKLVATIFTVASLNPKFFTAGLKEAAREWLTKENAESTLTDS